MTETDLANLLITARENNRRHHVTGILLYSGGTFLQVLEGAPGDVDLIFAAIERDKRHKNIIKLIEEPLKSRNFPEWSMGFTSVNAGIYKNIEGYLTSTDKVMKNDKNHSAISILKTFINTNGIVING